MIKKQNFLKSPNFDIKVLPLNVDKFLLNFIKSEVFLCEASKLGWGRSCYNKLSKFKGRLQHPNILYVSLTLAEKQKPMKAEIV